MLGVTCPLTCAQRRESCVLGTLRAAARAAALARASAALDALLRRLVPQTSSIARPARARLLAASVFDRPNEFLCCKARFDNRVMRHGISLKEPNPVGSRPCRWKIKDQILVTALRLPCGMKLSKETCVMARETGGEGWRKRERTRARVRERGSVINRISP